MKYVWLSWIPKYKGIRGNQDRAAEAHAFAADETDIDSLCGFVVRANAGAPASDGARRCMWCRRVTEGACERLQPRRTIGQNEKPAGVSQRADRCTSVESA